VSIKSGKLSLDLLQRQWDQFTRIRTGIDYLDLELNALSMGTSVKFYVDSISTPLVDQGYDTLPFTTKKGRSWVRGMVQQIQAQENAVWAKLNDKRKLKKSMAVAMTRPLRGDRA
jgi:hypothetical protein